MNKRNIWLYLMSAMYFGLGIFHLLQPEKYLQIMPAWLPMHHTLIYVSGIAEIILGAMLLVKTTRRLAAWLIIAMLVVFMILIHTPHTIDLFLSGKDGFVINLLRTQLQFALIAWAWLYTRKAKDILPPVPAIAV